MSKRKMKNLPLFILGAIAIFFTLLFDPQSFPIVQNASFSSLNAIDEQAWYPVRKVVDGDTLKIDLNGAIVTVRLIGLDTPEIVDPRRPVQCFAKEASAEMTKLVSGQLVRLETDPTQSTYDKYGRLLAYVYVPANVRPEGIFVNKYMISEGFGHEYTYDIPYKYQVDFKSAEIEARMNSRGLWAPGICQ